MTEEKIKEGVTFLNRGLRHFDLGKNVDGTIRRHSPGTTMTYTAEEAATHGSYKDLVDITKLPGQVDVTGLKARIRALEGENALLKAELEALPKVEASTPEAGVGVPAEAAHAEAGARRRR